MLDTKDLQAIAELMRQQKDEILEQMQQMRVELTEQMQQQRVELTEQMQQQRVELTEQMQQMRAELSEQMDTKLAAAIAGSEERMKAYIDEKVTEETNRSIAYTESVVEPRLDAIREGLDLALETRIPIERIERIEQNVIVLQSVVRKHSEEIELLKKAQ